jgi:hypothetical protein
MTTIKIGKLITVVLLTLLIWIGADLALEETYLVGRVQVAVGKSTDPSLWVSLVNLDGKLTSASQLDSVVLKGPSSKLQRVKQQQEEGTLDFRVVLAPEQWEQANPGRQMIALLDLLSQNPRIQQWGLTVESCSPEALMVQVDRLESKRLKIRCIDHDNVTINGTVVEPDTVDMYVPADWGIDRQASIELTAAQIARARVGSVKGTPFVELADGQRQIASSEVTVRIPAEMERLKTYTITNVRAGILITETLLARYQLKVENPQDLYGSFEIRATEEAKQAYEDEKNTRYQVILEVNTESAELQDKELIYNFPQKYLRNNEIEPTRPPAAIHFRLVPRAASGSGPSTSP